MKDVGLENLSLTVRIEGKRKTITYPRRLFKGLAEHDLGGIAERQSLQLQKIGYWGEP